MARSRIISNIQLGLENVLLHKLRSFLTMLGIVFGVASVIAMLSVGEGASREAMNQIRKLGSRNIIITAMKPVEEETSTGRRSRTSIYGLLYDDTQRIHESFTSVRTVVPVKLVRQTARIGTRSLEVRLVGTTPDWFKLVQRRFLAGRPLSRRDGNRFNPVAVLTEHGARRLLAAEHSIGKSVGIGGVAFEVVGILQSEQSDAGGVQTPDQDIDAYIPIAVARERFGDTMTRMTEGSFIREKVELHQLILEVDSIDHVEGVAEASEAMLMRFHPRTDYRLSVPFALLRQARRTKQTFNIVLGSIACISLVVGGIGIMNIMLASVTERTREIGIRRAVGARKGQIVAQFLVETAVLSTVGGAIGTGLGMLIPFVITTMADMPTVVTAWSVVLSLGISVGVGILFGIYPAFRAANLDPIVALRHE